MGWALACQREGQKQEIGVTIDFKYGVMVADRLRSRHFFLVKKKAIHNFLGGSIS